MTMFHVAPHGDDQADGSSAHPVARPERALGLARTAGGGNTIRIAEGVYEDVALTLEARDSGLVIEAAEGARPILLGGHAVTGWRQEGDFLVCDIPGVRDGTLDFRSPIVNGRFPERARYPEEGTHQHASVFDSCWMSSAAGGWNVKPTHEQLTTMRYQCDDLGAWLDVKNAEVQIFHSWDDSLVGLSAIDTEAKTVTFSREAGHPAGAFAGHGHNPKAKTYIVWNIREGMTRPGQWYLDRTQGRMVYWPLPGESAETLRVIVPTNRHVIHIRAEENAPVHDVTIRGLEIAANTTPLDSAGFGASKMPGMIEVEGEVSGVRLENLFLHHPGGTAIRAVPREKKVPLCTAISIRGCRIEDCGACGARLAANESMVEHCRVLRTGRIYTSAIAVTTQGRGNRVAHNEVAFCPYSAITAGGVANRVEENFIHDFMEVLDDGAAIYSYGLKHGLYRGNVAVGSGKPDRIAHAYYLDELSDGSVVEDNLAIDTCWPSHNHMSEHCTIRNNLFLDSGDAKITLARCHRFFFERNVMIVGGTISIYGPMDRFTSFFNNVLVSRTAPAVSHWFEPEKYTSLGQEPVALDHGNTDADPDISVSPDFRVTVGRPEVLAARGIALRTDFTRHIHPDI